VLDRLRGLLLAAGLILLVGAAGVFFLRYRVYQVPTTSMSPATASRFPAPAPSSHLPPCVQAPSALSSCAWASSG
jgi:hypothetical protein